MAVSAQDALQNFRETGYRFLRIEPEHAVAIEALPAYHADPFDRILIAKGLIEPMRLITHVPMVARYSDTIMEI